jgi:hypothetical protein
VYTARQQHVNVEAQRGMISISGSSRVGHRIDYACDSFQD